ncbi:uncharacterized protein LOC130810825 [Amaranthus tricolor]|uniref:uncharacterized protein LOC130810825 n=1 Tax=Amaranthus tricolor TaxID=29722 RepID=UPI002584FE66|nr:uncharacterized protein LOC130810825 [Amaranthus tricolor]
MEKFGFGRKWISWIMECVSSASMSILLKGSPLRPFNMEKGLRQDVRIGKAKVSLKHVQFADDILLFAPKNTLCIINYFRILDIFALMSGLAINYNKSAIISWKLEDYSWVNEIANGVGCIHARPPFTYLGFPLSSNFNKFDAWKPVISKIENR